WCSGFARSALPVEAGNDVAAGIDIPDVVQPAAVANREPMLRLREAGDEGECDHRERAHRKCRLRQPAACVTAEETRDDEKCEWKVRRSRQVGQPCAGPERRCACARET